MQQISLQLLTAIKVIAIKKVYTKLSWNILGRFDSSHKFDNWYITLYINDFPDKLPNKNLKTASGQSQMSSFSFKTEISNKLNTNRDKI